MLEGAEEKLGRVRMAIPVRVLGMLCALNKGQLTGTPLVSQLRPPEILRFYWFSDGAIASLGLPTCRLYRMR